MEKETLINIAVLPRIMTSDKPQLSEKALEVLVGLAQVNERFRNMEQSNPTGFHQWGEEAHQRYVGQVKPILEPLAEHYDIVKREMDACEDIYQRQISK